MTDARPAALPMDELGAAIIGNLRAAKPDIAIVEMGRA